MIKNEQPYNLAQIQKIPCSVKRLQLIIFKPYDAHTPTT